jgi:hypothetical protein
MELKCQEAKRGKEKELKRKSEKQHKKEKYELSGGTNVTMINNKVAQICHCFRIRKYLTFTGFIISFLMRCT